MTQQPPLFPSFTVHCFFGRCPYTVTDTDPDGDRHERMEAHYRSVHQLAITRLVSQVKA